MTRGRRSLVAAAALVVGLVLAAMLTVPSMSRAFFYPKPRGLPPSVAASTEELLRRLERVMASKAPVVAQSLQPGLPEARIAALEREGGFRLSDSLKSLYRWRNGMLPNSRANLAPGQRFVPLEEIVASRVESRRQEATATAAQRMAFSVFAGYRRNWVQVFDDGAGDGYFYDPDRTDAQGAFFYHMAEAGYYLWFPSFNNFLSGIIEYYETGATKASADGKGPDQDFNRARKIWMRLGKSSDGGAS